VTDFSQNLLERGNLQSSLSGQPLTPLQTLVDEGVGGFFGTSTGIGKNLSSDFLPDRVAGLINQTGAIIGLASILCSPFRRLRPFAAAGLNLLSKPGVAGLLLVSGGYSLIRQAPHVYGAAGRLFGSYSSDSQHSRLRDLLEVGGYGIGALGILVGAGSFVAGGVTYKNLRGKLLSEGASMGYAERTAFIEGDAVRRAVQDPEVWWIQYSRSHPTFSAAQRNWITGAGKFTNMSLLGGSAVVGAGKFAFGVKDLSEYYDKTGEWSGWAGAGLLFNLALDVAPGVTVLLYRGARGQGQFNMEPAMSQKLMERNNRNMEPEPAMGQHLTTEQHYYDLNLRSVVLDKLEKGLPRLSFPMEKDFIRQSHEELGRVEGLLNEAEKLPPLSPPQGSALTGGSSCPPGSSSPPGNGRFSTPPPQRFKGSSSPPPRSGEIPPGHKEIGQYTFAETYRAYSSGKLSPVEVFRMILQDPAIHNGAIFPRPIHEGKLHSILIGLARESERRFKAGTPRPLEGIFIAVKDLFPGVDGVMNIGSKTARITGVGKSPVVEILLELGAIPIPVNMTAAANGGSGMHSGFGYVPHPLRDGFDPAGSSSAAAHVVGLPFMPITAAIGSDTGGSIIAPAGAVGLFGFVPPSGVISTKNMVPFATFLDRVGVITRHPQDGMTLARYLSRVVGDDPHQRFENPGMLYQPSAQKPTVVYLEDLVRAASPEAQAHFSNQLERFREQGHTVIPLDSKWNFLSEVPLILYPMDAYPATAFTHTNPLHPNKFEPPRRTLDENLLVRLPKAAISLRFGLFDRARALSHQYSKIVNERLGEGVVLLSPSAESIPTLEIRQQKAGAKLDGHDRITMAKNRLLDWGQMSLPNPQNNSVGITATGRLPDLMHFIQPGEAKRSLLDQTAPFVPPPPKIPTEFASGASL
jgi:Asp-tRNA(Asn)/Glu-tRNA(Gln) amidotransferase A subunit family amidase